MIILSHLTYSEKLDFSLACQLLKCYFEIAEKDQFPYLISKCCIVTICNKKTKTTVYWKDGETSILIDAMEDSMELLVGHIKEHEYRRMRLNRWKTLLNAINAWNEDNNTGVIRSIKSIRTKIFNLRTRSK